MEGQPPVHYEHEVVTGNGEVDTTDSHSVTCERSKLAFFLFMALAHEHRRYRLFCLSAAFQPLSRARMFQTVDWTQPQLGGLLSQVRAAHPCSLSPGTAP